MRECKAKRLSPKQRYPDPDVLNRFKRREPYSFLHFSYYQVRVSGWVSEWVGEWVLG